MSRQITATADQIERALKGTELSKEEFLHRLSKIMMNDYKLKQIAKDARNQ